MGAPSVLFAHRVLAIAQHTLTFEHELRGSVLCCILYGDVLLYGCMALYGAVWRCMALYCCIATVTSDENGSITCNSAPVIACELAIAHPWYHIHRTHAGRVSAGRVYEF